MPLATYSEALRKVVEHSDIDGNLFLTYGRVRQIIRQKEWLESAKFYWLGNTKTSADGRTETVSYPVSYGMRNLTAYISWAGFTEKKETKNNMFFAFIFLCSIISTKLRNV